MSFLTFMKRWNLVSAIACAICAISCIAEQDWVKAIWYVVLTALSHYAYDLWKNKQATEDQRRNQNDQ